MTIRGYAIISCITAVALAGALTALLIRDAHSYLRRELNLFDLTNETAREVHLRELVDGIIRDTDSHRLSILPIIHRKGKIMFSDGTQNEISPPSSLNAPDRESDAISVLQLDSSTELRVRRVETGSSFRFLVCPSTPRPDLRYEERGFIGIGVDSNAYLRGTLSSGGSGGCVYASVHQEANMFLSPVPEDLIRGVRLLIPIVREYTLYLSKKQELRYAGHEGPYNVENQPLCGPVKSMKLLIDRNFEGEGIFLRSEFSFSEKRLLSYASASHLSRTHSLNLLLN